MAHGTFSIIACTGPNNAAIELLSDTSKHSNRVISSSILYSPKIIGAIYVDADREHSKDFVFDHDAPLTPYKEEPRSNAVALTQNEIKSLVDKCNEITKMDESLANIIFVEYYEQCKDEEDNKSPKTTHGSKIYNLIKKHFVDILETDSTFYNISVNYLNQENIQNIHMPHPNNIKYQIQHILDNLAKLVPGIQNSQPMSKAREHNYTVVHRNCNHQTSNSHLTYQYLPHFEMLEWYVYESPTLDLDDSYAREIAVLSNLSTIESSTGSFLTIRGADSPVLRRNMSLIVPSAANGLNLAIKDAWWKRSNMFLILTENQNELQGIQLGTTFDWDIVYQANGFQGLTTFDLMELARLSSSPFGATASQALKYYGLRKDFVPKFRCAERLAKQREEKLVEQPEIVHEYPVEDSIGSRVHSRIHNRENASQVSQAASNENSKPKSKSKSKKKSKSRKNQKQPQRLSRQRFREVENQNANSNDNENENENDNENDDENDDDNDNENDSEHPQESYSQGSESQYSVIDFLTHFRTKSRSELIIKLTLKHKQIFDLIQKMIQNIQKLAQTIQSDNDRLNKNENENKRQQKDRASKQKTKNNKIKTYQRKTHDMLHKFSKALSKLNYTTTLLGFPTKTDTNDNSLLTQHIARSFDRLTKNESNDQLNPNFIKHTRAAIAYALLISKYGTTDTSILLQQIEFSTLSNHKYNIILYCELVVKYREFMQLNKSLSWLAISQRNDYNMTLPKLKRQLH